MHAFPTVEDDGADFPRQVTFPGGTKASAAKGVETRAKIMADFSKLVYAGSASDFAERWTAFHEDWAEWPRLLSYMDGQWKGNEEYWCLAFRKVRSSARLCDAFGTEVGPTDADRASLPDCSLRHRHEQHGGKLASYF